jgi:hypothetical protein
MDIIHQVVISNTLSFTSSTMFMDIIKPKEAMRAFICVDKFIASYVVAQDIVEIFELRCDAVQNSYRYNTASNSVTRSDVVDTFLTTKIVASGAFYYAIFDALNNNDNWLEIDINRLPQIKFSFVSKATGAFVFNLHLKVKFKE